MDVEKDYKNLTDYKKMLADLDMKIENEKAMLEAYSKAADGVNGIERLKKPSLFSFLIPALVGGLVAVLGGGFFIFIGAVVAGVSLFNFLGKKSAYFDEKEYIKESLEIYTKQILLIKEDLEILWERRKFLVANLDALQDNVHFKRADNVAEYNSVVAEKNLEFFKKLQKEEEDNFGQDELSM